MTDDDIPILDAHQHFWRLDGPLRYPGLEAESWDWLGDYSAIRRDYLPDEYRRDSALHNVVGTVHVEAECDRSQQVAETEWLSELAERHGIPTVIVAHAWLDTPQAEEILLAHRRFPRVRGIRSKPVTAPGPDSSVRGAPRSLQDPRWLDGLGLLLKHDLSWDLRLPWWHLAEAAEVARRYPTLPIVLNHTGYPWDRSEAGLAGWRRGMAALAACPNVWCKLSGFARRDLPWTVALNGKLILEAIALFGVERCMFASNFPVDSVKVSWDRMYQGYKAIVAHLPRPQRERLFAGSAAAFYRIPLAASAAAGR